MDPPLPMSFKRHVLTLVLSLVSAASGMVTADDVGTEACTFSPQDTTMNDDVGTQCGGGRTLSRDV